MPKIKWIGIINDEIAKYQKSELDANAKKLEMPSTMKDMMLKALPFAIPPFLLIFLSMFIKTFLANQMIVEPVFILVGFITGFIGVILHEYLHAIAYPAEATVYIGVYFKAFAAVALASYPLRRARFIFMSLLPLILGIVPIAIFWFSPVILKSWNCFWFGFAIMGLISPYTDYYNVYQVLKQTPKGCYIQFYDDDTYWIE